MSSPTTQKIRILHVVPVLDMGGIEKGLVDAFAFMDHDAFQLDFLVERNVDTPLAAAARAIGCKIIPVGSFKRLGAFAPAFLRIVKGYDVVHAHTYLFSGLVMFLARLAGVKQRIAHMHNKVPERSGILAALYRVGLKGLIKCFATHIIAVSRLVTTVIYGEARAENARLTIQPMGVDFLKFHAPFDAEATRASLGIKANEQIVVNVSRFSTAKNHDFIIDVFDQMVKQLGFAGRLLLIGDGDLRPSIVNKVAALGLQEQVIFAGTRYDAHNILRAIKGVFIFPSLYEGLGLVAVEAQAAGLPIIMSEHVPEEARISQQACRILSLNEGAGAWAKAVMDCFAAPALVRADILEEVEQNKINIQNFVQIISDLYRASSDNKA